MKSKKLENLEKKFGLASKMMTEFEDITEEITNDLEIAKQETFTELTPISEEVFSLTMLKSDFMLIRQNILGLVSKGNRILDQVSTLDLVELKAGQIEALSSLQSTIATNLKMIFDIYKMISDIEKNKVKNSPDPMSMINTGSVTNNNIVFSGSSSDLLELIKNNQQ